MRKRTLNIFVLLALVAALMPAAPALASEGLPPGISVISLPQSGGTCSAPPRDENGNFDLSNLERAGDSYTECLACIDIGGAKIGIATSFDRYADAEGRYYLVPNAFTALYMAITGWAPSFSQGPVDAQLNGFELVAALMGRYENVGGLFADLNIPADKAIAITGKSIAEDWGVPDMAKVFRSFAADASFWINLNIKLFKDDLANGTGISLRSMVLIYCDDPTVEKPDDPPIDDDDGGTSVPTSVPFPTTSWTPYPSPTPCPDCDPPLQTPVSTPKPPTATPPPTPTPGTPSTPVPTATPQGGCKASSISRSGTGTVLIEKIAPPNPVVVGQDESRRGVNVHVRVVSPAVVYTYEKWEVVSTKTRCCHDDPVTGWRVCQDDMAPCSNGWTGWSQQTVDTWGCKEYKETYTDPVDLGTLNVQAVLTGESRTWIETKLARKYPGAKVQNPVWELIPLGGWKKYESVGGNIYTLDATIKNIPLVDPGNYELHVSGRTTGTRYTAASTFSKTGDQFGVVLIETALIK